MDEEIYDIMGHELHIGDKAIIESYGAVFKAKFMRYTHQSAVFETEPTVDTRSFTRYIRKKDIKLKVYLL
jgi:hypothetical protein